jgi:hypothetical protein
MKNGRRVLGIALLVVGVLGLVLFTAGIVGVWIVKEPLGERLLETTGRVERALDVVGRNIKVVDESAGKAREELAALKEAPPAPKPNAGAGDKGKRVMKLRSVARGVSRDLPPQLSDLRTTMGKASATAVVVNSLVSDLGHLSLGPSVRLDTDQLHQFEETLTETAAATQKLSASMGGDADSATAVHQASAELDRVLGRVQALTGRFEERVAGTADRVRDLKARLPGAMGRAAVLLTVVLAWALLGQVGLLFCGRALLRRRER